MKVMKAMAKVEFGKDLVEIELEDPIPADDEVILDVTACGVCQTDLKVAAGIHPTSSHVKLPHIPGHEITGIVSQIGRNVEGWKPGDSAVVYHYVGCGSCRYCRAGRTALCPSPKACIGFTCNGGFAEKVKLPASNLVRISSKIPAKEACIIPDALATAVHAVVDRGNVSVGERVMIIGAGGVGLHALQVARICGAYTIVADIDEKKLELARQYGADETQLSYKEKMPPIKVDKIIEVSGALAENMWLVDTLENGGTLVTVGYRVDAAMKLSVLNLVSCEWIIKGSRACGYANVAAAVDMVERGLVRPVVSATYPFIQVNEVLAQLKAGKIDGRAVLCRDL